MLIDSPEMVFPSKGNFTGIEVIVHRIVTTTNGSQNPITGWEVANDTVLEVGAKLPQTIAAVSETSGIFAFRTTGIWRVDLILQARAAADVLMAGSASIMVSDDNFSTESNIATCYVKTKDENTHSAYSYTCGSTLAVVKISDISLDKVKFACIQAAGTFGIIGSGASNATCVMFTKLADL